MSDIDPLNRFWCPCCHVSYEVGWSNYQKSFWCACGRILRIDFPTAYALSPDNPGFIESPDPLAMCFRCGCSLPCSDLHFAPLPLLGWLPDAKKGECVEGRVMVCAECFAKGTKAAG